MSRLLVVTATVVGVTAAAAAAAEGYMWWRNVHPQFPEHGDEVEDQLEF